MKGTFLFLIIIHTLCSFSQTPDSVYVDYVKTPQLYAYGSQVSYPIISLNSSDRLELDFDDIDADVKNYFYTYELCNSDWTPAAVSQFDYLRGFLQLRINNYRFSSIALTKYTHYLAVLPDVSCVPTRSGNYLVKVFLDGDTSKLVFTRRLLIVQAGASIGAQVLQPFNPATAYSHQKLQVNINTRALNILDPNQQLKVIVLQNHRWDIAIQGLKPSFYSGSDYQYNSDDGFVFPAGKQWRWLDIQSFRFQSDRVQNANYQKTATAIFVKPDIDRSNQAYYFYNDIDGQYYVQTSESISPLYQADYATVHFTFVPSGKSEYPDQDVYLIGAMTNYQLGESTRMHFNAERGMYEGTAFLKMGYYNYAYATVDRNDPQRRPSTNLTEGNSMETENEYTILVYYRELGGRTDQLVGMATLNSLNEKQ